MEFKWAKNINKNVVELKSEDFIEPIYCINYYDLEKDEYFMDPSVANRCFELIFKLDTKYMFLFHITDYEYNHNIHELIKRFLKDIVGNEKFKKLYISNTKEIGLKIAQYRDMVEDVIILGEKEDIIMEDLCSKRSAIYKDKIVFHYCLRGTNFSIHYNIN